MTTDAACPCLQQQLSDLRRLTRCLEHQVVRGVRTVDSRCEWLQQQRDCRAERCRQLAEITRCLQHQAEMTARLQQHLLQTALARRGLRALRSLCNGKPLLHTVQLLPQSYVGVDYIAGMFDPCCHGNTQRPQQPYNVDCQSSLSDVHILYVHPNGHHVQLINNSAVETELGNHFMAQLDVNATPVVEYQLPARLKLLPSGVVTLWATLSPHAVNCPPTDIICDTVPVWNTTNDYTTVLRRPDGQATAWTTTARVKLPQQEEPATETVEDDDDNVFWSVSQMMLKAVLSQHSAAPSDDDNKHQLSTSVSMRVPGRSQSALFPCLDVNRCHGNRSSIGWSPVTHRQQSSNRPAAATKHRLPPIPELSSAGAAGSRMGSAALRKPVIKSNRAPACSMPMY